MARSTPLAGLAMTEQVSVLEPIHQFTLVESKLEWSGYEHLDRTRHPDVHVGGVPGQLLLVRQEPAVKLWPLLIEHQHYATNVVYGLAALVLLYALWRAVRSRARVDPGQPYCRRCRYQLTGHTSDTCPECGALLHKRRAVRIEVGVWRQRVRRWGPLVAVLIIGGAYVTTRWATSARWNWHNEVLPYDAGEWFEWPSVTAYRWLSVDKRQYWTTGYWYVDAIDPRTGQRLRTLRRIRVEQGEVHVPRDGDVFELHGEEWCTTYSQRNGKRLGQVSINERFDEDRLLADALVPGGTRSNPIWHRADTPDTTPPEPHDESLGIDGPGFVIFFEGRLRVVAVGPWIVESNTDRITVEGGRYAYLPLRNGLAKIDTVSGREAGLHIATPDDGHIVDYEVTPDERFVVIHWQQWEPFGVFVEVYSIAHRRRVARLDVPGAASGDARPRLVGVTSDSRFCAVALDDEFDTRSSRVTLYDLTALEP